MFVIKHPSGAFVCQNTENSKELNYVHTTIENAEHYTQSTIDVLKERFKGTFSRERLMVYPLEYRLGGHSSTEQVVIYKFQLESIKEAVHVASNVMGCKKKASCLDKMMIQAEMYADNALKGEIDIIVPYI